MSKHKVRILHNLARSGGTLISKCLGCMPDILLLSEIHPVAAQLFPQANNPLVQAFRWHGIITPEDLGAKDLTFVEAIRLIENKCAGKGKQLLLRDWAYFDFVGFPFIESPSHKLLLAEMLADDFEVVRLALVRHPIDQWLSMIETFPVLKSVPVELYLAGYWEYSQQIQSCGFVRYEDFTRDPVGQMEVICHRFQLEFDRDFMARWQEYDKITGDTDRAISRGAGLNKIVFLPRRPCEDSLLQRFRSNKIYVKALELLGYEDA